MAGKKKLHIEFREVIVANKRCTTKNFEIRSKHDNTFLGIIHWYNPWRQYIFNPAMHLETIWSVECLDELREFIAELMNEKRAKNA